MRTRTERDSVRFVGERAWLVAALAMPVAGQVTTRMSVDSAEVQANGGSYLHAIAADGRYVAFVSEADNLVSGDTNAASDVFVRDREAGTTELVSVGSSGAQANYRSDRPSISPDGRFVAFDNPVNQFVSGDTNGHYDVFLRDRLAGTTEWVSVSSPGAQGNGNSWGAAVSADGRFVAFVSLATDLVPGDTNGMIDIFVRDRLLGTTERVSVDSGGAQGNDECDYASISGDGRFVAFQSRASNLVVGDTNGTTDVFLRDRLAGTTERISVDSSGGQGNDHSAVPSISADGRYVAISSDANSLVAGDTNGKRDIFVHDRQSGTTELVSVATGGTQGNGDSTSLPKISADGRYVAFASLASNLVAGDTNAKADAFVHDRQSGTTERVSVASSGAQGNSYSFSPTVSADGRCVTFYSLASNLVSGDTNPFYDVFVRDRAASGFTSLCDPGVDGVVACPCSNPPSGSGRGCDNASATGGASLAAGGAAYLSMDGLVFTTSGERPSALSIVLQGNAAISSGAVYGQGVRCAGGALRRLYMKSASGGSITAPDFGMGEPSVSEQSAAKGDPISAGQSRWYLVYYRDPTVLGGCPSTSTFNATQTGHVAWSP